MALVSGARRIPSAMPRVNEVELERTSLIRLGYTTFPYWVAAEFLSECLADIMEDL